MPSKTRDSEVDRQSREKRHKSVRSSHKSSSKDRLRSSTTLTSPNPPAKRRTSMPVPELERRASSTSPGASKTSLPYPSFSKAHSKEAVGSRDNVANPRLSYYTPDPTDLEQGKKQSEENGPNNITGAAPPSPPLTHMDRPERGVKVDRLEKVERKRSDLQRAADELKRKLSRATSVTEVKTERRPSTKSRTSQRDQKDDGKSPRRSKTSTPSKPKPKPVTIEQPSSGVRSRRSLSPAHASATGTAISSNNDSDATSIAPNQPKRQPQASLQDRKPSPPTEPEDSPKTPTLSEPRLPPDGKETPAFSVLSEGYSNAYGASPMPPPPPPPPNVPFQQPKVDYLLLNGGLPQSVSKSLLGAGQSHIQDPSQPLIPHATQVSRFFAPFNNLLEDYNKVIAKNGSMAAATGYRSIARRLLDRLEAVFARDISSETCTCVVCGSIPQPDDYGGDGVSWGEILEYVSGRRELSPWPAFVLDSTQVGLGISTAAAPCQKLDIDVPEEYKEHYINQSKKTKQAVNSWLESQPANPVSAPQDVDDETLTFAMLTRLEPDQRPIFSALVGVTPSRPSSAASTISQTPTNTPSSDLLSKTALAIQRLYRLSTRPRDPESAIYLLSNPSLHNVLATLAAISDHEWDVLTSGRFDGFLRSGAEDHPASSRGPTPANQVTGQASRGPTPAPATAGAPVALDEETEIAVLAEVEREIFFGMEALEDAFEALHVKAETVRLALRERGAGLSIASQARKGGEDLDARLGTPASQSGGVKEGGRYDWESETDDGWAGSEIVPDDSASNISRSRRRRPKRREERRTPAPVEEESDEG